MDELKNLNEIGKGIDKQWVWGNKDSYYRSCDYLQKINYCIQDLNREFHNLSDKTMKELVFIIVLVDWICEAYTELPKILRKDIVDKDNVMEIVEDTIIKMFYSIKEKNICQRTKSETFVNVANVLFYDRYHYLSILISFSVHCIRICQHNHQA